MAMVSRTMTIFNTMYKRYIVLVLLGGCLLSGHMTRACMATGRYSKTSSSKLQTTFLTTEAPSGLSCAYKCSNHDNCESVNYQRTTGSCQFSAIPAFGMYMSPDAVATLDWNIYNKRNDWTLVFRGTPGIGVDIYASWINGTDVTTDDVTCQEVNVTSCPSHYRNPILDSWGMVGITKVRYSLYNHGNEMAYVTFDGVGTNYTSWFASEQIVDSSWLDISTQEQFKYFSLQGHEPTRRFLVGLSYDLCNTDVGYTLTLSHETSEHQCPYDLVESYPQFLYVNSRSYGILETDLVAADVMAIHVLIDDKHNC